MKIDPRQANVELHIEELVLYGFAAGDRYAIAEAVEKELVRLFVEQGATPSLAQEGDLAWMDGGTFEAAQDSRAEAIGNQVAQAVYGGLSR